MPDFQRGFNIGVFKEALSRYSTLKPNLFHVEFSIPNTLVNRNVDGTKASTVSAVRFMEYFCEATSFPGINMQTWQAQRYGYGNVEQRPLIPNYGEITLDIIFDASTVNYDFFIDWFNSVVNTSNHDGMNEVNNTVSTGGLTSTRIGMAPFELSYREDYVSDIRIYLYDRMGNNKKIMVLRDSFPKAIGDIRLAWADNNSYMRLPVMFSYNDWHHEPITTPNKTPIPNLNYFND